MAMTGNCDPQTLDTTGKAAKGAYSVALANFVDSVAAVISAESYLSKANRARNAALAAETLAQAARDITAHENLCAAIKTLKDNGFDHAAETLQQASYKEQ